MPEKPDRPATRILACLYSPPIQRPVLEALCRIECEIAASLRPGLDHRVAHTRLQWWREECQRSAQGRPMHPLTRELISSGARLPCLFSELSGLVDTAVWDLAGATFETRGELTAYCERWSAAMIEPAAPLASESSTANWRALGAALREVELISHLARDAHSGRLRVPLDELERVGVEPAALATPPWPSALSALLRERHEALRTVLATGVADIAGNQQPEARGLLVWAALAWQMSARAQRMLPNPVHARRHEALADAWYAWRAARRAVSGRFRLS